MTSTARNPRLPCPYCDKKLLCRDFGSHIFLNHKEQLFSPTTDSGQTNRSNLSSQNNRVNPIVFEVGGEKTYWCLACQNCAKREHMARSHLSANKYDCREKHKQNWETFSQEFPRVKGVKTASETVTPTTKNIKRLVVDLLDEIHHLRGFIHLHRDEIKFYQKPKNKRGEEIEEETDEIQENQVFDEDYTYEAFGFERKSGLISELYQKSLKDFIDLDEETMREEIKKNIDPFYRNLRTLVNKKEDAKPKEPEPEPKPEKQDERLWTETIENLESVPPKDRLSMAGSMPLLKSPNAPLWFKEKVVSLLKETEPESKPAPPVKQPPEPPRVASSEPSIPMIYGSKRRPKSESQQFPPQFQTQAEPQKHPTIISMTRRPDS